MKYSDDLVPMSNKRLELENIAKQLSNIPAIYSGGCGIAAYALYQKAKELFPDGDVQIVYSYNFKDEYKANESVIESNDLTGVHSPAHCYITLNGERIDVIYNEKWNYNTINTTREFLEHSITSSSWNPRFNRGEWIPEIEQITGVDLQFALH